MTRLLLVDDELALVDTLTVLLELEGYEVVTAANGLDGLQRLGNGGIDLAIVDLMMPILGGLDMLRVMRSMPEHASTPAILISAAPKWAVFPTDDSATEPASDAKLYQVFLQKPFDLEPLLGAIERLAPGKSPKARRR
jgi:CheY-like chemotaxis protein